GAGGRAAACPAVRCAAPAPRLQLALLDLGQPVLSRDALMAPARELRPGRRNGGRPRLLRRSARPPRRTRTRARGTSAKRRLHHRDLPMIVANHLGEHLVPTLVARGAAPGPAFPVGPRAR